MGVLRALRRIATRQKSGPRSREFVNNYFYKPHIHMTSFKVSNTVVQHTQDLRSAKFFPEDAASIQMKYAAYSRDF